MVVRDQGRRKSDQANGAGVMPQTVFIVDDDDAVREALAALLGSIDLHAESYESGTSFLDAYSPERSGCLLLDVRMRGLGGIELQQVMNQLNYDIPIIFITGHGDVALAVHAMRAGAFDFVEKPFRDQYLLERVNQALQLDLDRRRGRAERAVLHDQLSRLTPREREVMERVVRGQSNKVIAIELGLSERTVEIHRAKMMAKAGARSLAELISMLARCERP